MTKQTPGPDDLWFLPLGGCGEIGMNLNLYGHNGQWLMVDCGVSFDKSPGGDHKVMSADPDFICARRDTLAGIVITHAHEDHVGALPQLWSQLKCPVYTTPFTAEILRRKLTEVGLVDKVPVNIVPTSGQRTIGHFDVQWVDLTHSIPEPQALVIRTPAGTVFHTADWKLDPDPVVGHPAQPKTYKAIGKAGITAMVCDSTNALDPGVSESEGRLYRGLFETVQSAQGRVIVGCFGSNLARLQTLVRVANATDRYAALYGRSLLNMVGAARATGHWPDELSLADPTHLGYLPAKEILGIATGSQGEPRTALARMAADNHPQLELEPGDTVIFSSRVIPGNDEDVARLVKRLEEKGIKVVQAHQADRPIHASGHPSQDELHSMYTWIAPKLAIPVHGEERHMKANATVAKNAGVPRQLTGENGDLFSIAPAYGVKRRWCHAGRIVLR